MANEVTVLVKRVIPDFDCRQVRRLQEIGRRAHLKEREVILAYNRVRRMARMVDAAGAIHCYWKVRGEAAYAIDELLDLQEQAIGIKIRLSQSAKVTKLRPRRLKKAA